MNTENWGPKNFRGCGAGWGKEEKGKTMMFFDLQNRFC
jgi:hypothetical protein